MQITLKVSFIDLYDTRWQSDGFFDLILWTIWKSLFSEASRMEKNSNKTRATELEGLKVKSIWAFFTFPYQFYHNLYNKIKSVKNGMTLFRQDLF